MLVSGARGDAETEVLGRRRHGRNDDRRISQRDLGARTQRGLRGILIGVIDTHHIGEEQGGKTALFEDLRKLNPVRKLVVVPRRVLRVLPQARGLVTNRVHRKSVEKNRFFRRHANPFPQP